MLALDSSVSGEVERDVGFHETTGLEARDAEAPARKLRLRVMLLLTGHALPDPAKVADVGTWRETGVCSVRIEG